MVSALTSTTTWAAFCGLQYGVNVGLRQPDMPADLAAQVMIVQRLAQGPGGNLQFRRRFGQRVGDPVRHCICHKASAMMSPVRTAPARAPAITGRNERRGLSGGASMTMKRTFWYVL